MPPKELLLIIVFLGVVVAIVGVYLFYVNFSQSKKPKKEIQPIDAPPTIDELLEIAESPKSKLADLEDAADLLVRHYPDMTDMPGKHLSFIYLIAKHHSSNAKIIMRLDKAMKERNPDFTKDIDNSEKKGLDAR